MNISLAKRAAEHHVCHTPSTFFNVSVTFYPLMFVATEQPYACLLLFARYLHADRLMMGHK